MTLPPCCKEPGLAAGITVAWSGAGILAGSKRVELDDLPRLRKRDAVLLTCAHLSCGLGAHYMYWTLVQCQEFRLILATLASDETHDPTPLSGLSPPTVVIH